MIEKSEHELSKAQAFTFKDNTSVINYAAIYTDIIPEQFFGDSSTPILINLISNKSGGVVKTFENPMYLPINRTYISSINIKIVDLQGNLIRFSDDFAYVIVKLHFRKILNELPICWISIIQR
jgi:hypothetical protein